MGSQRVLEAKEEEEHDHQILPQMFQPDAKECIDYDDQITYSVAVYVHVRYILFALCITKQISPGKPNMVEEVKYAENHEQ